MFNLFKKEKPKELLVSYTYAMQVRSKYEDFVERKIYDSDSIWVRDNYDITKEELLITYHAFDWCLCKKTKEYKKLSKDFIDWEILMACLDDTRIDWCNITNKEANSIKFDPIIINACMNFLFPYRVVLTESLDKNNGYPKEMERVWDFCQEACELILAKFGVKGQICLDEWVIDCGIAGLVSYCLDILREQEATRNEVVDN